MYLNHEELNEYFLPYIQRIEIGSKFKLSDLIGSFDMVMRAIPNRHEIEYVLNNQIRLGKIRSLGSLEFEVVESFSDNEAISFTDEEFEKACDEYSISFESAYSEIKKNINQKAGS